MVGEYRHYRRCRDGAAIRGLLNLPCAATGIGWRLPVGVCYIDPPNLEDMPLQAQLLGAAVVATIGELMIFIGDQLQQGSGAYWQGVTKLLEARRKVSGTLRGWVAGANCYPG